MSRYTRRKNVDLLPLSNDYILANLFGNRSNDRVLACLLNAILNWKHHIKSVRLEPTEYKKTPVNRKAIPAEFLKIHEVKKNGQTNRHEFRSRNAKEYTTQKRKS